MAISVLVRELAEEIMERRAPASPRAVTLPEVDDELFRATEDLGQAEGQSFVIEYVDSAGRASTRRVTVWSIVGGRNGVPTLQAMCHERKAMRQFRIDRIRCCVDYDGEVFEDVPQFLAENFGMSLVLAAKVAASDERWLAILSSIRHDAVLLAALAKSDGRVRPEEVEVAKDYLSRLAEQSGMMLDEGDISSIGRYVSRLRPTEDAILRALNSLQAEGGRRVRKLLLAAAAVVDADGKRHEREIAMINAIAGDLLGAPVM